MRTIVDIPEKDIKALDSLGKKQDLSRAELVRRGVYNIHQVSADVIKNWVRRNPGEGRDLLFHNPSYVFFREVSKVPADPT